MKSPSTSAGMRLSVAVALQLLLSAPVSEAYNLGVSRAGRVQMVAAPSSLSAAELRAAPAPTVKPGEEDILLRAAKGEQVSRPPVWLMRQAGRYMRAFREFSDNIEFRQRSETPDIAIELSLQPWKRFGTDGVIMFSDILTPLPAMGIEFDVVRGKGPVISSPLRTMEDVAALTPLDDPLSRLPFINTILGDLKNEIDGKSTLLGFVGSPFTLVAYSVEGSANRHCINTKRMMMTAPEVLHAALDHISKGIAEYACYQIECGAQSVQFFESWAHHIGPMQFAEYAKPYADKAMAIVKERYPDVPVMYYANGGSSYLDLQKDMACDVIAIDWAGDMAAARQTLGADRLVAGNVDPTILYAGTEQQIHDAVRSCREKAGTKGHILNVGHGVLQGTPEEAVQAFVNAAKIPY